MIQRGQLGLEEASAAAAQRDRSVAPLSPFHQNARATCSVVLPGKGTAEVGYPLRGRLLPRLWSAAASFRFSRAAFFRLRSLRQRLIDLEPRPIEMSLTTNSTTFTPQPSPLEPH